MIENKVKKGKDKFDNFVKRIGIKSKMRTLTTHQFEELADLKGDLFKLKCIEYIYDEFYNTYVAIDFRGLSWK